MQKKIYVLSEHHSPENLKIILEAENSLSQQASIIVEPGEKGTRSVTEVLNVIVQNSGIILSLISSMLLAWKLYLDQQKARLEAKKLELEERKQALSEEQFAFEKRKWEQAQKELTRKTPKIIRIQPELGEDIVFPLQLMSIEETEARLQQRLKAIRAESIKGIVFE